MVLVAAALVTTACASGSAQTAGSTRQAESSPTSTTVYDYPDASARFLNRMMNEPRPVENSAMPPRHLDEEQFPESLVDRTRIVWGGVAPDAIASIDEPTFEQADTVDWIEDQEAVLVLQLDGEIRVYPVQVMIWHEIVNDRVDGRPVTVTYCPLCNSAVAFDRRIGDRVLDFGTSGSLYRSALVMYDRQTESLWSHFTGTAVVGELTGTELETFPSATVPWALWRDAYPDGLVLSQDTGFNRSYGRNPYPGYDDVDSRPFLFEGEVDGRYTAMTRLVGVEIDGDALAVPLQTLRDERAVAATVGDVDIVVLWEQGTASALDTADIASGDDVGATGVFIPVVDGQTLTFAPADTGFVDDQTGSGWNLLGKATTGPLAGAQLEPVAHVDTFWFAWGAFRPDSAVVGS